MLGNYQGQPSKIVNVLNGIKNRTAGMVAFLQGCDVACGDTSGFSAAEELAKQSDIIIAVMGINQEVEAEGHDRRDIGLPGKQEDLIASLRKVAKDENKPFVLVLVNGGALAMKDSATTDTIVEAWYPGEEGGNGLADVLCVY